MVMTTPRILSAGLGRCRTFSMVSSRSSVPSSAKYDDWIGMSRCVAATRALTVSSPRAGGQSMTTWLKPVELGELVLETERRVQLPHQPRLELRQRDARRARPRVSPPPSGLMTSRSWNVGVDEDVVHPLLDLPQVEVRHAAVGLGIEIDEQRRLAAQRQGGGEVEGGRRLADAALLVRDGEDHLEVAAVRRRQPDPRRGSRVATF